MRALGGRCCRRLLRPDHRDRHRREPEALTLLPASQRQPQSPTRVVAARRAKRLLVPARYCQPLLNQRRQHDTLGIEHAGCHHSAAAGSGR